MVRYHGNWCGPNWTAGQRKPASALTDDDRRVPAIDALDAACKEHDVDIADAETKEDIDQANDRFIERANQEGVKGKLAAVAVRVAGPSQPDLPASGKMPRKGHLRGSKRARPYGNPSLGRPLPDYEEIEAEDGADDFSRSTRVAFQDLENEENEDRAIRDVLLRMQGNGDAEPFVISASEQGYESSSFYDSTDTAQAQQNEQYEPLDMATTVEDTPMEITEDRAPASLSRIGPSLPGGSARTNPSGYTTPIAKIKPSYPFHNTVTAVMQHHGATSTPVFKANDDRYLKIRMNTYLQPYAESAGAIGTQTSYGPWQSRWSDAAIGRYVTLVGNGAKLDELVFHRGVNNSQFSDKLFAPNSAFTDPVVAAKTYYESHYNAYTVTKCEWTVYVEMPYHNIVSSQTNTDNPVPADVYSGIKYDSPQMTTPPCFTSGRVFTHYSMQGDTITGVNPPLNATVLEMERFNNAYENKVTVPVNGVRVIRGTWFPGKVKHNPVNDADIETWTPSGQVPGQGHLEHLVLQFKESANTNSSGSFVFGMNIHINLKYYVQWKELKQQIQFPLNAGTNPSGTVANSVTLQGSLPHNV